MNFNIEEDCHRKCLFYCRKLKQKPPTRKVSFPYFCKKYFPQYGQDIAVRTCFLNQRPINHNHRLYTISLGNKKLNKHLILSKEDAIFLHGLISGFLYERSKGASQRLQDDIALSRKKPKKKKSKPKKKKQAPKEPIIHREPLKHVVSKQAQYLGEFQSRDYTLDNYE